MVKGTGRATQIKRGGGKSGFYQTHSVTPEGLAPSSQITPVPIQIVEETEIEPVINDNISVSNNSYVENIDQKNDINTEIISTTESTYIENIKIDSNIGTDIATSESTYTEFNPQVSKIPDTIPNSQDNYIENISKDSILDNNVATSPSTIIEVNSVIPTIDIKVADSPDTYKELEVKVSNIPSEIPKSQDSYVENISNKKDIDIEVSTSTDISNEFVPNISSIPNEISNSQDTYREFILNSSNIPSEISNSPDTYKEFILQPSNIPNEIPTSKDSYIENIYTNHNISQEVQSSPDTYRDFINKSITIPAEISESQNSYIESIRSIPQISPEVATSQDTYKEFIPNKNSILPSPEGIVVSQEDSYKYKRREFVFSKGKWIPFSNLLTIDGDNFSVLKNFRYHDDGLEGVDGTSIVNTNGTGKYMKSGIQLRTNYTEKDYILAQISDSSGVNRLIIENRATVPATGEFDGYTQIVLSVTYNLYFTTVSAGVTKSNSISIQQGTYTGTSLKTELQRVLNLDGVLCQGLPGDPFTVTYSANKYTIAYAGTSVSFTYLLSDATMAGYLGFTADAGPGATIISDTSVNYENPLYTEDTSAAGLARFAILPAGNVGICDGHENLIYAGDEIPVGAFLYGTEPTLAIGASANDEIQFTSNHGTATIDIPQATYTGITLAAAIQVAIRANGTIALPSAIVEFRLGKFYIDAGESAHTILFTGTGDGALQLGFTEATTAAKTMYGQAPWINSPYLSVFSDNTNAVNNNLTTSGNTVAIGNASAYKYFLIGSTRPIQGMRITTTSGNFATGTLSGKYFDGEKLVALSSLVVSTSGSVDTVTFTDTSTTAKPMFIDGYYLFFYRFELSTGAVTISNITLKSNIQNIVDIWDGIYRTCSKFTYFRYEDSKYSDFDFTLEVASESILTTREYVYSSSSAETKTGMVPIGADVGGSGSGLNEADQDYIEVMFEEPMCAFKWDLYKTEHGGDVESITVYFWDGTQYVKAQNVHDTLKNDETYGATTPTSNYYMLKSGGVQFFGIPLYNADGTAYTGVEVKSEIKGIRGYRYKITWTYEAAQQRFLHLILDRFTGVPRYRTIDNAYVFPMQYRNRTMLCGCITDDERNRVNYSGKNTPDVYNGTDASGFNNERSIKFGGRDALTCGIELFNQRGDTLNSCGLFFKNTELHVLAGDTPSTFTTDTISRQIGCPAPLTLDTAEVAYGSTDAVKQNVALWMSDKGPMMYFNNSIKPLMDNNIREYFISGESVCINSSYTDIAAGIYDPNFNEYHLVIPSGTSTTNNVWLIYDLARGKWRENYMGVTGASGVCPDFPQSFIRVADSYGNKYIYALTNTGYMIRLDNGRYWSGPATTYGITHTAKTGDILFTGSAWDEVEVRRIKLLYDTNAEGRLAVKHYLNGALAATNTIGTSGMGLPPTTATRVMYYTVTTETHSYRNLIMQCAAQVSSLYHSIRGFSHAFEFIVTLCTVTKPKLLGWAAQWHEVKEDILDKDGDIA